MNVVITFAMAKSSKIGLVGLYYQIKRTFCRKQINISHFVLYNTFLECCNPRFLNKTEIKIIKMQPSGHNASVFLTHVGIQQMPTWKAKSLLHQHFFADVILCATWKGKFKTIKIKLEKNPYTQANTCLLHISRNFKDLNI